MACAGSCDELLDGVGTSVSISRSCDSASALRVSVERTSGGRS